MVPVVTRSLLLPLLAVVGYVTGLDWGKFAKYQTKPVSSHVRFAKKKPNAYLKIIAFFILREQRERDRLVKSEITTPQESRICVL